MSRHDLVSAQTSIVCITCHAAIACMCQTICDTTSSNVLGRLVQCEQKRWDMGRWIGIHTQRVKTAGLCVGLDIKSLSRVMILKNRHFTGPPCNVQVRFISIELLALPKQLDHKCAQNDRVQLHLQPGAGKPHVYCLVTS